jgi:hypothetical protein
MSQQKNVDSGLNTGTWSLEEDERLRDAVAKHGTRWVTVASDVSTRTGDQCAKRWNENLNPYLDRSPWSPVEVSGGAGQPRRLSPTVPGSHPVVARRGLIKSLADNVMGVTGQAAAPSDRRVWAELEVPSQNLSRVARPSRA